MSLTGDLKKDKNISIETITRAYLRIALVGGGEGAYLSIAFKRLIFISLSGFLKVW